jgi:hypothetical protein
MNAPTPLNKIIMARKAATEHKMRFPGPMLEIPWRIQPRHLTLDKNQRRRLQRLLIPAAAKALDERGVTIRKPEYNTQYRAARARPNPRQQWLFDAFR